MTNATQDANLKTRSFATPRPNSDDACRGLYLTADS